VSVAKGQTFLPVIDVRNEQAGQFLSTPGAIQSGLNSLILRKAAGLSRRMRGMLRVRGPSFEAPLHFVPQDEAVSDESRPEKSPYLL